jgi:hypothetical protein
MMRTADAAGIRFDAASENCIFYISPMYEFSHRVRLPGASFLCLSTALSRKAPSHVEANFENVLVLFDIDDGIHHSGGFVRHKRVRAGAEIVIVLLGKAREPVGEGIFTADANRPAAVADNNWRDGGGDVGLISRIKLIPAN